MVYPVKLPSHNFIYFYQVSPQADVVEKTIQVVAIRGLKQKSIIRRIEAKSYQATRMVKSEGKPNYRLEAKWHEIRGNDTL